MVTKPKDDSSTNYIVADDGLTRRIRIQLPEFGTTIEYDSHYGGDNAGYVLGHVEGFGSVGHEFWSTLEVRLLDCDSTLASLGCPRLDRGLDGFPVDGVAEIYSTLWYAGRVGRLCWLLLEDRKAGKPLSELHLSYIMQIGSLWTECQWRGNFASHTLRGKIVKNAAKLGAEGRKDKLEPDTQLRLAEMTRRIADRPDMSISWAAEQVYKAGLGRSAKANRALWYRHNFRKL